MSTGGIRQTRRGNGMTPSEAHDSAWKREAGHDEMQLAVANNLAARSLRHATGDSVTSYRAVGVRHEVLFQRREGRAFFVDTVITYRPSGNIDDCGPTVHWLLEIKPKIYSAGALLRQCKVLKQCIGEWKAENRSSDLYRVVPVVPVGDPLLETLCQMAGTGVYVWDDHVQTVYETNHTELAFWRERT
jgi:hypothetical protein